MKDLFPSASARQHKASAGQLQAIIDLYRQDLLTGFIEIALNEGGKLILLLVGGRIINTYHVTDVCSRLVSIEWTGLLASQEASVRVLPLPARAARLLKVIIEQSISQDEVQARTSELDSQFAAWQQLPSTSLAYVAWPDAQALVLIPGSGQRLTQSVFISADGMRQDAIAALHTWGEPLCTLSHYQFDAAVPAWVELDLHIAFTQLCNIMLGRYEEYGGRALVSVLSADLNALTRAKHWEITSSANSVFDQHLFPEAKLAATAYAGLLEVAARHIGAVIGRQLTQSMIEQGLQRVSPELRQLALAYGFFPADLVSTPQGVRS